MHEDFLHPLLHLLLAPLRVLLPQPGGFDLACSPVKLKSRAQLLRACHAAQSRNVFRCQVCGHDLSITKDRCAARSG